MPILITPATAHHAVPVTLSNTLGYPVVYKVSVTSCSGTVVGGSSSARILASGKAATILPTSRAHRLVTFTVARADQAASGIRTQVALTSRQGCPLASRPSIAALPTPAAATGVAVHAAPSSHDALYAGGGGIALVTAITIALGVRLFKRPRHGGLHS
jgi:hypothetical protein